MEGLSPQVFPITLLFPLASPAQLTHIKISLSDADCCIASEALDYLPVSHIASPYGLHCSLYFSFT